MRGRGFSKRSGAVCYSSLCPHPDRRPPAPLTLLDGAVAAQLCVSRLGAPACRGALRRGPRYCRDASIRLRRGRAAEVYAGLHQLWQAVTPPPPPSCSTFPTLLPSPPLIHSESVHLKVVGCEKLTRECKKKNRKSAKTRTHIPRTTPLKLIFLKGVEVLEACSTLSLVTFCTLLLGFSDRVIPSLKASVSGGVNSSPRRQNINADEIFPVPMTHR